MVQIISYKVIWIYSIKPLIFSYIFHGLLDTIDIYIYTFWKVDIRQIMLLEGLEVNLVSLIQESLGIIYYYFSDRV